MALIVQKFGGSSVGTLDRIHHVAEKVIRTKKQGHDVIVVVSAMYGETDRLIQLAHALTTTPDQREYDVLLSTGEQVSIALLSMALNAKKICARSFTGSQIGIRTDATHTNARILDVEIDRIKQELGYGHVVIIAGFQGINSLGDITTLGRGGSDTTAVAVAAALKADECQIYTDVDGIYTTDPHLLPEARLLPQICFAEMLEMASMGAKVLQIRSVELASKYQMPIRVLSTFTDGPGTLVTVEEDAMLRPAVSGVAYSCEEALITIANLPYQAAQDALVFEKLNGSNIDIDMFTQTLTIENNFDLSLIALRRDYNKALKIIEELKEKWQQVTIMSHAKIAKLSLIGIGIRSERNIATTLCNALAKAKVPIFMLSSSEIKISVIVNESDLETGVRAIHQAFELDKPSAPFIEKACME